MNILNQFINSPHLWAFNNT